MTSITPPTRPAHSFAYNAVDMESGYTPPALPGLPATATQYAYNLDKQVTSVTRPDGQAINFNYDTGGRLSSLGLPGGASIVYQYSATTGKLTSVSNGSSVTLGYDGSLPLSSTWSGTVAGSVSKTYDNNFRVTSMSVNGANTVALAYDRDSLLTGAGAEALTRNASNGFLTGTVVGVVNDAYVYNSFGETTGYTAKTGTLPVYSAQFTHDALGRIAQKTETLGTATINYGYTYDTSGRLTAISRGGVPYSSYQYDANGNRLGKTVLLNTVSGTYDAQDRLTSWNGMTYAYTANGELTSKASSSGTTTYTYDVLGNLLKVVLPNGTVIDYLVDGVNRRIGKKVNGALVKGWLYDGIRPVAELDGTGAVISTFVYASKGNAPDYMVKGGNTYRIISDHLGSPRLVIDSATGAVMQQIDYDEYGVIANDTNPGFQPFGFAGGLYDSDTKLTRFGARDYEADTGRWTAKDPIRFSGGDTNLYGYVLNDPVNFVDPSGLLAPPMHFLITLTASINSGRGIGDSLSLAWSTTAVDWNGSQGTEPSSTVQHGMAYHNQSRDDAILATNIFIRASIRNGNLAGAIHAAQDLVTPMHDGHEWEGIHWNWKTIWHGIRDITPSLTTLKRVYKVTKLILKCP